MFNDIRYLLVSFDRHDAGLWVLRRDLSAGGNFCQVEILDEDNLSQPKKTVAHLSHLCRHLEIDCMGVSVMSKTAKQFAVEFIPEFLSQNKKLVIGVGGVEAHDLDVGVCLSAVELIEFSNSTQLTRPIEQGVISCNSH